LTSEREFNSTPTERKTEGIPMKVHTLISICRQSPNDSSGCDSLRAERSGARTPGEGNILLNHPERPRSPRTLLYNGCLVSFSTVRRPGRDAKHPPLFYRRRRIWIELYLCLPSVPAWHVTGQPLPLPNWEHKGQNLFHIKYLICISVVAMLLFKAVG